MSYGMSLGATEGFQRPVAARRLPLAQTASHEQGHTGMSAVFPSASDD